jgi:hypothetical protein
MLPQGPHYVGHEHGIANTLGICEVVNDHETSRALDFHVARFVGRSVPVRIRLRSV